MSSQRDEKISQGHFTFAKDPVDVPEGHLMLLDDEAQRTVVEAMRVTFDNAIDHVDCASPAVVLRDFCGSPLMAAQIPPKDALDLATDIMVKAIADLFVAAETPEERRAVNEYAALKIMEMGSALPDLFGKKPAAPKPKPKRRRYKR